MSRSTPNQIYKIVKTADNRFEKKDYKKSLEGYKKALTMKPNKEIQSHCYLKIGLSQQFLENYPDSLSSFNKSLDLNRSFVGYFYRGILFMTLQKYKEAEDDLKDSLKVNTHDSNALLAYVNLARVYLMRDKTKDALKTLKNALDIKENDINALLLLAETYKQTNDIEKAKETYLKTLTFSQNRDAIIGLGSIYMEMREEQQAISLLKGYLQNHPDPELLKIKGEIHFSLNDFENALSNFKKARKLADSESLLIREARCLISLKRPDDALTNIQDYISSNKNSILAKIFLAELYASTKQHDNASKILNELIQTEQSIHTNPNLCQTVANTLLINNEYDKAETLFTKANSLGKQSWPITKQLVLISIEKEEFDKALERTDNLFSLSENSSQIGHSYHLKAIIYYKQKLYEEAAKIIEEGLHELRKSKNEQYYILSLLLIKITLNMGKEADAQNMIDSLLKENSSLKTIIEADSELKGLVG